MGKRTETRRERLRQGRVVVMGNKITLNEYSAFSWITLCMSLYLGCPSLNGALEL